MHRSLAYVITALIGICSSWQVAAQASADSTRRDSTASASTPAAAAPTRTPMAIPTEILGYRVKDSARVGDQGVQYTYVHGKNDKILVFITPYPSTSAAGGTTDDTVATVEGDVDVHRQSLDGAYKRGDLTAFQSLREHPDDFKTGGRTVRGYMMFAALTHRGGGTAQFNDPMSCAPAEMARNSGRCPRRSQFAQSSDAVATDVPLADVRGFQAYTYYGVYAIPQSLIHVRAEMPQQTVINAQVLDFAHKMVAALVIPQ
jgi:hypothetical protein